MNRKIKIAIVIILVIIAVGVLYYLCDYSHAEETATKYLNGTDDVNVSKIDSGLFLDGYGNDTAVIFYPGAKIEYTSYLPMLTNLASEGVDSYLVEMPFNLAFLGQNQADSIINTTNYSHYILAGHSLGGYAASSYMAESGNGDGLILLAGYPNEEIEKPVLSIYGSADGALNRETYNESLSLMDNVTEIVIKGGNHAQFGYYGNQSGDNPADITAQKQQKQSVDEMIKFIDQIT